MGGSAPVFGEGKGRFFVSSVQKVLPCGQVFVIWGANGFGAPMLDDLFLILAAVLAGAVALLVWKKRPKPGAFPLFILMGALVVWAMGALLAQSRDSASAGRFWNLLGLLGTAITPAAWLAFAFQYTGRGWRLTRRNLFLLAVEPILFLFLVSIDLLPLTLGVTGVGGTDWLLTPSMTAGGVASLLHQLYSYSLILVGTVMLVQSLGRSWELNRGVTAIVLAGAILPCIGALAGYWNADLAPLSFVFTGVMFAWGIRQYRLLDRIPHSREILLENMGAGLMVLDMDDRVVDLNPPAERILGCALADMIARPVYQAAPGHASWIRQYQGVLEAQDVILLGDRDAPCPYDLRISPLIDRRGESAGRIFSFHDVTRRMQAGQSLREREQYLSLLHDITRAALEGRDLQSMLQTVADRLGDLIQADGCYVTLWDEEGQRAIPATAYGQAREFYASLEVEPGEMTITESVLRAGHPLVVDDVAQSPYLSKRIEALLPDRSLLALPLIAREQKLGAILVSFHEPHHFTSEEVQRIDQAARQIALAIDKVRLLEAEREQRRAAENLRRAAETVSGTLSMGETLPRIFEQLERVVSYDSASLFMLVEEYLQVVAARGFPSQKDIVGQSFAVKDDLLFLEMQASRRPLILHDARENPRYQGWGGSSYVRGWMGVPLVVRDHVIGCLTLDSGHPGAYGETEAQLVQAFADQAAVAIDHAQLYENTQRQAEQLSALYETARDLISTLELGALLELIVARVARLMGAERALILLVDTDANAVTRRVGFGYSPGEIEEIGYQEIQDGISGWVLREQVATISEDTLSDPRNTGLALESARQKSRERQSIAVAPLLSKDGAIGTLTVSNGEAKPPPDQSDLDLIVALADLASIAIERARLYAETERRLREQTALREAVTVISSILDQKMVLSQLVRQMGSMIDATSAYFCSFDLETMTSTVLAEYISPHATDRERVSDLGANYEELNTDFLELMESGRWDISHLGDPNLEEAEREHMTAYGAQTVLYIPLRVRGQLMGFAELWESRYQRNFTPAEIALCQDIAQQAAIAFENARLYRDAQLQVAALETLRRTSLQLTSSLDLSVVLDGIAEGALTLVGATDCHIYLYDEASDSFSFGTALWDDGRRDPAVNMPRPDGLTATVAREGRAIIINDAETHGWYSSQETQAWNVKAIAGFPLKRAHRVVGVFNIAFLLPHTFGEHELRVLELLGDQAAIAIENARLVQRLEADVANRTAEVLLEQEKSETILNNVRDAIMMVDPDQLIVYINPAFTTLTGYAAEDAFGKTIYDLIGQETGQLTYQSIQSALARGEAWRGTILACRKDGRSYDATLTFSPMHDAEGRLIGHVASHQDISQLKNLERARQKFIENISHELLTPVTNIKLRAQMLQKGVPLDRAEHSFQVLSEQADRLENLIQDIIKISRLDSGQAIVTWTLIPVASLLRDVITRHLSRAAEAGLILEVLPAPATLPPVMGDRLKLAQALDELIENAIIFTAGANQGRITIRVGTTREKAQTWVTIAVSDNGPGISRDEQDRIFDRFFRGRLAEAGHVPGTGLGLSMVYEIVQSHGGRVTVDSQLGEGSTFSLWLRAGEKGAQDDESD